MSACATMPTSRSPLRTGRAPHLPLAHERKGVLELIGCLDDDQLLRHHLIDRRLGVKALRDRAEGDVAVGDDPHELLAVADDRKGADTGVAHPGGGLLHGRVRLHGQGIPRHGVFDLHLRHVSVLSVSQVSVRRIAFVGPSSSTTSPTRARQGHSSAAAIVVSPGEAWSTSSMVSLVSSRPRRDLEPLEKALEAVSLLARLEPIR
jgi:hypothetical protein